MNKELTATVSISMMACSETEIAFAPPLFESGTLARRVYCIHCRATTENVRTNIVRCVECERWLLVRDHYSRRLAAYMGVMVDAEAPGELPPLKEVFL